MKHYTPARLHAHGDSALQQLLHAAALCETDLFVHLSSAAGNWYAVREQEYEPVSFFAQTVSGFMRIQSGTAQALELKGKASIAALDLMPCYESPRVMVDEHGQQPLEGLDNGEFIFVLDDEKEITVEEVVVMGDAQDRKSFRPSKERTLHLIIALLAQHVKEQAHSGASTRLSTHQLTDLLMEPVQLAFGDNGYRGLGEENVRKILGEADQRLKQCLGNYPEPPSST